MNEPYLHIEFKAGKSYQQQIREKLVELILKDQFGDQPLPSCRKVAQQLGVSRNTVVHAYEGLIDEGYLIARERKGFFVNPDIKQDFISSTATPQKPAIESGPNWHQLLPNLPSRYKNVGKDKAWMSYDYPFIYGQIQHSFGER